MLDENIGNYVDRETAREWLYENLLETGYGGPIGIKEICERAEKEKKKNFNSSTLTTAIDDLIKDGRARTFFFSLSGSWALERIEKDDKQD